MEGHNRVPEGFCAWAWAEIQKDLMTVMFGGDLPWMKQRGTNIVCCSDGMMPVVFKIERVPDEKEHAVH